MSVTEMEFRAALASNPRKIRAYLKPARNAESRQAKFIKQVRDFHLGLQCPSFHTLEQLKNYVVRDAVTYYGNQERLNPTVSLDAGSIRSIEPGFVRNQEQSSFVQPPGPSSTQSKSDSFIERQRTYFQTVIHKAKPSKLAKGLILNLSPDDRFSLGLIAKGNILARTVYLKGLFPGRKWPGFLQRMQRRGFLVSKNRYLLIADNVKRQLQHDEALTRNVHAKWISALTPKAGYSDLALAFCLHLIALKRFGEAIAHAHLMILSVEDHSIAKLFYELLVHLSTKRIYRKLSHRDHIFLLDGVGIFQGHEGHLSDSLKTFNSMLTISRRVKDHWGIGQAFLHRGVTWAQIGDDRQAIRSYKQAAAWAQKRNDEFLLGRALHNWSQSLMADNPERAAEILDQSIKHKRRARDRDGLFAIYTGRGILAGQAGRHKVALHWFRRAERLARHSGSLYGQSHALHNQALSLSHLGQSRSAVRMSHHALRIADALGRKDLIIRTAEGKAFNCYRVQDYKTMLSLLLRIHTLKKEVGDIPGAIVALSDSGIMELYLKRYDAAKNYIRHAISLSKSTKTRHWLMTCIRNYTAVWHAQGNPRGSVPMLRRQLDWAERADAWEFVAEIAEILAQLLVALGAPIQTTEQAWLQSIAAAEKQDNFLKQLELLRQRYAWIRETQGPEAAVAALRPFLELTTRRRELRRDYVQALDEMGTCLQNCGRHAEAEKYYRRALKLAQTDLKGTTPPSLLNNYAELLRKTGRGVAAIPLYKQAIAIDKSKGDLDSRLLTEHNLALALNDVGRGVGATKTFLSIQKIARKRQLWEHYVRAHLALADASWMQNQRSMALRRYANVRLLCTRYQLRNLGLDAALNEARLLQELDRSHDALSLLQPLQGQFAFSQHCLDLFFTLGRCLIETGRYQKAISILEESLKRPEVRYSIPAVTSLRASLVEASLQAGTPRKSQLQIERLLAANVSPEERVKRLRELLSILAAAETTTARRGYQTERLLDEIQRIAKENKQPAWISETYEQLGQLLWSKDRKASSQLYTVGMIKAVQNSDLRGAVKIGSDLGSQLHRLGLVKSEQSVLQLQKQTEIWLRQQLKKEVFTGKERKTLEVFDWLLWPFRLSLRILHRPDKGRKIKLEEMNLLLQELLMPIRSR